MPNIQYDIILYISSFLYNINDYKNMMLINKEIYNYLYNFYYKKIRLQRELNNLSIKYYAIEEKNDDDLYYPSSFYNQWNVYNCICYPCPYQNVSVGVVYTYCIERYEYNKYNENNNQNNNQNNIESIKNLNDKCITRRYIPYCKDCMEKYINNSIQANNNYMQTDNDYIIALSYY